jgi:hypothetical protein
MSVRHVSGIEKRWAVVESARAQSGLLKALQASFSS